MSNQERAKEAARELDQLLASWSGPERGEPVTKGDAANAVRMICDLHFGSVNQIVESQRGAYVLLETLSREQANVSEELNELVDGGGREPWRESLRPDMDFDADGDPATDP